MLRITWVDNGEAVFTLRGRLDAENVADVKTMFSAETKGQRSEANGIELRSCLEHTREWVRERGRRWRR